MAFLCASSSAASLGILPHIQLQFSASEALRAAAALSWLAALAMLSHGLSEGRGAEPAEIALTMRAPFEPDRLTPA